MLRDLANVAKPRLNRAMLKALRMVKRFALGEVARKAKITRDYLMQLEENPWRNPSSATLNRLARALGVPVTALLR